MLRGASFSKEKYRTFKKRWRGRSWDVIQRCLYDVLADYPPERKRYTVYKYRLKNQIEHGEGSGGWYEVGRRICLAYIASLIPEMRNKKAEDDYFSEYPPGR